MVEAKKLVVGPCVVKFPNLVTTEEFGGVDTGKYSATFMFDKDSDSVKAMKLAIAEANGGKGSNPLKVIADDAEYDAGMDRIKAKSKFRIRVVDAADIAFSPGAVAGATVQAVIGFAPYSQGGGGVTAYLNAIRVLRAGDGGGTEDFGPVPAGYESDELNDPLPF
jgi:hypothetical protein